MGHAIARKLELSPSRYEITFQSRLGKDAWTQPYTSEVVQQLGRNGAKKILMLSPSFSCDCLETLYELKIECHNEFVHAGGERLDLVEALNSHPEWVSHLKEVILGCV